MRWLKETLLEGKNLHDQMLPKFFQKHSRLIPTPIYSIICLNRRFEDAIFTPELTCAI